MLSKEFPNGVWPVVLTPFHPDGSIDFRGYGALLDFYLANRVAGLFAVCLSSELYHLTPEERLALARFTVRHVGGAVPVICCGGFGSTERQRIDSILKMADIGVDAVVAPACQVVGDEADEEAFKAAFVRLLEKTGETRLGLYECPLPYHRLISPSMLGELARLGGARLPFIKDTCCDRKVIRAKLAECAGTGLKLYNANLTTFLDSLRAGAAGYSGTSANFYPAELATLCEIYASEPERAERMQRFFNLIQRHVEFKYPRAAKLYLRMCGVPIGDTCRVGCENFTADQLEHLKALRDTLAEAV